MNEPNERTREGIFSQAVGDYLTCFEGLIAQIDIKAVVRVAELLRSARDRAGTIYIAGNGGSSATAAHLANDLGKATKRSGRAPIKVLCLSDNVPWLTALANDEGYERVFVGQLENFAGPTDVLIAISASGNSPNLVAAVDYARSQRSRTVGVLGFDGGVLKNRVDEYLLLESKIGDYGPVETGHSLLCDLLTTCLIHDRSDLETARE